MPRAKKMRKTSQKLCRSCKYHCGGHGHAVYCEYILRTGKRRDCEIGECNKYEKGTREEHAALAKKVWKDFVFAGIEDPGLTEWWWDR